VRLRGVDFFRINWYHDCQQYEGKGVCALEFLAAMWNNLTATVVFPVVTLFFLTLFFLYYFKISQPLPGTADWVSEEINKPKLTFFSTRHQLEKRDVAPILIITAVFSFLALFSLGDRSAPQSFHHFSDFRREVYIELREPEEISEIMFYTGLWTWHYPL